MQMADDINAGKYVCFSDEHFVSVEIWAGLTCIVQTPWQHHIGFQCTSASGLQNAGEAIYQLEDEPAAEDWGVTEEGLRGVALKWERPDNLRRF